MFPSAEIAFIELLIPPLLIGLCSGIVFALTFSLANRELPYWDKLRTNFLPAIGFSIPIVLVGYVAGYFTGISRSPVVGAIVPSFLALIGGLNIYLFGVDTKNRPLVGYCVFIFASALLYGTQFGGEAREIGRTARLIYLSEQEKQIRAYRANRGLPEEPPSWILGAEPK
jgi:hypothetical protein